MQVFEVELRTEHENYSVTEHDSSDDDSPNEENIGTKIEKTEGNTTPDFVSGLDQTYKEDLNDSETTESGLMLNEIDVTNRGDSTTLGSAEVGEFASDTDIKSFKQVIELLSGHDTANKSIIYEAGVNLSNADTSTEKFGSALLGHWSNDSQFE